MPNYWLKLWLDILDDPKVGAMEDWLFRRMIMFFLAAKEDDNGGLLKPVKDLAWRLRLTESQVCDALSALSEVGVVNETDQGWLVTNFDKRQAPQSESLERVRKFREKKKKEEEEAQLLQKRYSNTLPSVSVSSSDSDSVSNSSIGSAMSQFDDPTPRECERLYQLVTGQVCIPGAKRDEATESLTAILDHYKTPEAAQADGKAIFARWCNTRGKNGKPYSRVNPGWLTWWLDEMAPMPQVDQADELMRRVARDLAGGR